VWAFVDYRVPLDEDDDDDDDRPAAVAAAVICADAAATADDFAAAIASDAAAAAVAGAETTAFAASLKPVRKLPIILVNVCNPSECANLHKSVTANTPYLMGTEKNPPQMSYPSSSQNRRS
jgi:hypothetical protein